MEKVGDQVRLLKKKLNQWFLIFSKFSEDLLEGLDKLNNWPNKVKIIKKLDEIIFWMWNRLTIEGKIPIKSIKCYTTRPDTLFGFLF